jgi:hypothetical protein
MKRLSMSPEWDLSTVNGGIDSFRRIAMRSGRYAKTICRLIPCMMGLVTLAPQASCYAAVPEGIVKHYEVKIELFSIQPDRVLDSYEWHGSGMAVPGSTVQLACKDESRNFSVRIQPCQEDNHLFADVTVIPGQSDTKTLGQTLEADLSTLEPKAINLGGNEDGRIYMLNLTPGVKVVDITPKRADETAFDFNRWVFQGSAVVVNDRLYAGKIGASGGYKAFMDISSVGKFEFALQPFRDAELLGTLQHGQIHIECDDGTTIEIYDVKNGVHEMQLPGGPYAIWVRRSPSTQEKFTMPSEEQYSQRIKAHFARIGRTPPSDEELHRKYEQFKSLGPPVTMRYGVGTIPLADRVE